METKRVARRKHSKEFRAEVIQACREPSTSVAAIALRSGLNANVVYRWLREDAGVAEVLGSRRSLGQVFQYRTLPRLRTCPARCVLEAFERQHPNNRNPAIQPAFATGAYNTAQLARHFELHYTSVSRSVKSV